MFLRQKKQQFDKKHKYYAIKTKRRRIYLNFGN